MTIPTRTPEDAGELQIERIVTSELVWIVEEYINHMFQEGLPIIGHMVLVNRLEDLFATEQTKLLEKIISEAPQDSDLIQEQSDYIENAKREVNARWRAVVAKHKEGLKQ